jgi:hypothetical protein
MFFQIRPLVLCHASANLTSYCMQGSYYFKANDTAYPGGQVKAA